MKKFIVLAIILACFNACGVKNESIQTGDLIFVALPLDYDSDTTSISHAIAQVTGKENQLNYIHVAIADVEKDSIWIIDATIKHGVDRHPLDTFFADFTLSNGELPIMEVKRLKDNKDAKKYVSNAKQYLGQEYDFSFLPNNDKMYCTELVWESYLDENGNKIFSSIPMNFKAADGTYPQYWIDLYAKLGMDIPQGVEGTNPQQMHESENLESVAVNIFD